MMPSNYPYLFFLDQGECYNFYNQMLQTIYTFTFSNHLFEKKQMKYTNLIESVGFWLPINRFIGETSRNTAAT